IEPDTIEPDPLVAMFKDHIISLDTNILLTYCTESNDDKKIDRLTHEIISQHVESDLLYISPTVKLEFSKKITEQNYVSEERMKIIFEEYRPKFNRGQSLNLSDVKKGMNKKLEEIWNSEKKEDKNALKQWRRKKSKYKELGTNERPISGRDSDILSHLIRIKLDNLGIELTFLSKDRDFEEFARQIYDKFRINVVDGYTLK
ncbi:MAG: hypothetical protein OXC46_06135, partial [Thaumarchaeota archaeon]|nr:hypothetical protein [Nitrososphaerota archaeon]